MCIEPDLQPIGGEVLTGSSSNTQDGARLDIVANGFWGGRFERTFFDVRVFNPHAPFNRHPRCYRKHELEKKRQYEQRVREIEHASLTPLVLSATGGMANEATVRVSNRKYEGKQNHSVAAFSSRTHLDKLQSTL